MKKRSERAHSIGYAALEILGGLGEATLETFFPKNYSYTRIWRPLLGLERSKRITRRTISTILWRLRCEGLVERKGATKNTVWHLTPAGEARLRGSEKNVLESHASDGITRLVIFDIPEYERKKRAAIRAELIGCGFRHFQKSVWMGECPLPKSFIMLVDDLELAGKVHIFSVRERGTIDGIN